MRQEIYGNEGWIAGRDIYYCAPGQTLADWDSDSLEQERARCQEKCRRMEKERKRSAPNILFWTGMLSVACLAGYIVRQLVSGAWLLSAADQVLPPAWLLVCSVGMVGGAAYWLALRDKTVRYGDMMQMYALRIQMIDMELLDRK